jgi:hypothetical protein
VDTTGKTLRLGRYRHSKSGKEYDVLGIARHSETLEEVVVYRARYGECDIWVRPYTMFFDPVVLGGVSVPRFVYVDET